MPVVQNTLLDPSGNPIQGALVQARLAVSHYTRVYRPATTSSYDSVVSARTNSAGLWELTLTPNSLLTPSNTVYEIKESNPFQQAKEYTVLVPNGAGPYWVTDIEVDPPGDPDPSETQPLSEHLSDDSDAHDASAISFTPGLGIGATNVQDAILEVVVEAGGGGGGLFDEVFGTDVLADADGTYFIHGAGFGSPTIYLPPITVPGRQITVVQVDDAAAVFVRSQSNNDYFNQELSSSSVAVQNVCTFTAIEVGTPGYWAVENEITQASGLVFVPAGGLVSTNVQAAIEEAAASVEGVPTYIQDGAPSSPPDQYVWIQTGLGGGGFTIWFEDGT